MDENIEFNTTLEIYLETIEQPLFYKVDMTNAQSIFFSHN